MKPLVSIVIPFHWMKNWQFFLNRCLASIERQNYKNYEVVLIQSGSMPSTSNRSIESARGDLIKVLYMDDYFGHEFALEEIVNKIGDRKWLVTGCLHDSGDGNLFNHHVPEYTQDIHTGNNCIGSPSVLTMKAESLMYFDEKLSWLLDCDLYKRLFKQYGSPAIVPTPNVVIGLHEGQASNLMSSEEKMREREYLKTKYA